MLAIHHSELIAEVRARARGLEHSTRHLILEVADRLEVLDQVDVVPVVRCENCKHWCEYNTIGVSLCNNPKGLFNYCGSNDFCSRGKGRDGG